MFCYTFMYHLYFISWICLIKNQLNYGFYQEKTLLFRPYFFVIWTSSAQRPLVDSLPALVTYTLKAWGHYLHKGQLSTRPSPLSPMFGDSAFPPTFHTSPFLSWTKTSRVFLRDTLLQGSLPPFSSLLPYCHNPSHAWLEYLQLGHYFQGIQPREALFHSYTEIESLLIQSERQTHILSVGYKLLLKETYQ